MCGQFGGGVGLFSQVPRETDTAGVERFLFLGEIRVGVRTNLSPIEIHHVDGFITCHKG